jgi:hypothetical protein
MQTVLRRNTNGQKTHEEMLTISDHRENSNQNHMETPPRSSQNGGHQKHQQMVVKVWGKGMNFYPAGGGAS